MSYVIKYTATSVDPDNSEDVEVGWVDQAYSRTVLYENAEDVRGETVETLEEAIDRITVVLGDIEEDNGRGTYYVAGELSDIETGRVYTYAAHVEGTE